jgi:hopanoid biosynthesis associated protein HpnK
MKRLIVNADDFGLTEKVNQAIVQGHRSGIITSTTLMANGMAFNSAVALAQATPELGVGIHLNLTTGKAISCRSKIPGLVDARGVFCNTPEWLVAKLAAGTLSLSQVEQEFQAQIGKVLSAGVFPTHLDGHKHVHLFPPIFKLVIRMAKEYGIAGVRCTRERSIGLLKLLRKNSTASGQILSQYLVGRLLSVVSLNLMAKLQRARLNFPNHFFGIAVTGFLDTDILETIICHVPEGTSELMCHPGYVDADLTNTHTRLLKQREREIQAMLQPEIKRLLVHHGIELISYRHLN